VGDGELGAGRVEDSGQLRGLPVQQLKIDRQFIVDLEQHDDDTIIASIIDLGHRLGLTVVAEGVESEVSARRLADLRCDELQGFHFARPMPADQVSGWIARREAEMATPAVVATALTAGL